MRRRTGAYCGVARIAPAAAGWERAYNLRLRDIPTLTIDEFDLSLHVKSNTAAVAKKWVDNVVAATSYIGPLVD